MRPHYLFALALFMPAAAWCEPPRSAVEWLNRMSRAAHDLSYEGTFTYEHDGRMQTMQLFHGTGGEGERDRLITLDGASREVVREGGRVTAILPDHKAVVEEEAGPGIPLPINVPTRIDQLESFYQTRVGGLARVAGEAARKIVIVPRDHYRYGQTLWLDEKTGLLLKAELRDGRNGVVEQLVFTRLKVYEHGLPAGVLKAQSPADGLTRYAPHEGGEHPPTPDQSRWVVTNLPAGFREEMRRTHNMPGTKTAVEHRVFSDGLASVSVFIEPARGRKGQRARTLHKGALNAYTRYVDNQKVTVLGDVPAATVRLIGDGVTAARTARQ
jgi:sigma-E factor negative regulatory protein RseB